MMQKFKNERFKTLISYFWLAVAIIAAYKTILEIDVVFNFMRRLFGIISPFISGFILAYILNIPCGGIQKLLTKTKNTFIDKNKKVLSIIITYILVFFVVFLVFRLIIPSVYGSVNFFMSNFQTYYNSAQDVIRNINDLNILDFIIDTDKILASIRDFGLKQLPSTINALFGFSSALFSGFLAFVSSIYILFEKEKFKTYLGRMLKALLPDTGYNFLLKHTRSLNQNFKQYIYTQTIDGCILGTVATIELYLLGSPYALILGVMLGIVNYVPYFGSIIGSCVAVLVVAFTQGIPTAALTAAILLATQQIDGNIIQPRLMSGSFSLSPLLVIISITVGGAFYGILGMMAAIPIVAVIKNILDEIILYYEQQRQ